MVPWWVLVVCVIIAFSAGVLIMAMVQLSAMRDSAAQEAARRKVQGLDGLHPLDTPS